MEKISFKQAFTLIEQNIQPIQTLENIFIEKIIHRISGVSYQAPQNIPNFDNAAVDGIAFSYQEYQKKSRSGLKARLRPRIRPRIRPRLKLCPKTIKAGEQQQVSNDYPAVRIMTGAAIPHKYDTIVMQEEVIIDGEYVILPEKIEKNTNIRKSGEDVKKNQLIIQKGQLIKPATIARIASTGMDKLKILKKPKIAIISTGDEIVAPGTSYQPGMLYDANSAMLKTFVEKIGGEPCLLPVIKDDRKKIKQKIIESSKQNDMLLISGGAGPGIADHITNILSEITQIIFSQISIKPGRPLGFALYDNKIPIFSLPGNPVAVFVCFHMFVAQAIKQLAGRKDTKPKYFFLPIKSETIIAKKPQRTEFWRATIIEQNNQNWLQKYPKDGSGIIESIANSDGIAEIEQDVTSIKNADILKFYPYDMQY